MTSCMERNYCSNPSCRREIEDNKLYCSKCRPEAEDYTVHITSSVFAEGMCGEKKPGQNRPHRWVTEKQIPHLSVQDFKKLCTACMDCLAAANTTAFDKVTRTIHIQTDNDQTRVVCGVAPKPLAIRMDDVAQLDDAAKKHLCATCLGGEIHLFKYLADASYLCNTVAKPTDESYSALLVGRLNKHKRARVCQDCITHLDDVARAFLAGATDAFTSNLEEQFADLKKRMRQRERFAHARQFLDFINLERIYIHKDHMTEAEMIFIAERFAKDTA